MILESSLLIARSFCEELGRHTVVHPVILEICRTCRSHRWRTSGSWHRYRLRGPTHRFALHLGYSLL